MTTAELIWGWTQFILNVVLIVSSFKIVYDISIYVKHSDRRFKALYLKVGEAGVGLSSDSRVSKQRKFRHLVAQLIELEPEIENPFVDTSFEWAAKIFEDIQKRYNTFRWKLWH